MPYKSELVALYHLIRKCIHSKYTSINFFVAILQVHCLHEVSLSRSDTAKYAFIYALAAWSSGIVSVCGVMGREIESRQGVRRVVAFKERKNRNIHLPIV
jgi:hypothetical protein